MFKEGDVVGVFLTVSDPVIFMGLGEVTKETKVAYQRDWEVVRLEQSGETVCTYYCSIFNEEDTRRIIATASEVITVKVSNYEKREVAGVR